MMPRDLTKDRAALLLENIKPELLRLLGGSPNFGSVGIELTFHDGEISRIISKMEVSRLPRHGGAGSYDRESKT
jgi:hypothetical protein